MSYNNCPLEKDENGYLINPNPGCKILAYCRVSTKEQNLDRQLDAMKEYGIDPELLFAEKESGKNLNRTAYKRLIHVLRRGDILVIKSIDRLGRNYNEILEQWRLITMDLGCGIHVLDMPSLNTSGNPDDLISRFITDMMLQVLSFVAQNERENTIKRQKEGIAAAKRRGIIKIGRPKIKIPFEFWEIFILWKTGEVPTKKLIDECHETYGMSQRTFYRRLRELDVRYGDIPPERLRDLIVEDDFKDGIAFDMERCEAVMGYYNSYAPDPRICGEAQKRRLKKKKQEELENPHKEEEELKRIILEKRQKEFQQKFGIKPRQKQQETHKELSRSRAGRKAIQMAEDAMTTNIKTVIID